MRRTRSNRTLIAALILVVLTNGIVLAGGFYNRIGQPKSLVEMSQRELPISWHQSRENSGISLQVDWRMLHALEHTSFSGPGTPGWLDSDKLAQLGFEIPEEEGVRYTKQLPKQALLVLEMNGPAYEASRAEALARLRREEALLQANPEVEEFTQRVRFAKEEYQREAKERSRLFVVDAGLDPERLRRVYPDRTRYIIAQGKVRMYLHKTAANPNVTGHVAGLSISHVHVPFKFRQVFEPFFGNATDRSYAVTMAWGKRLEPWVVAASEVL